MIDDLFSFSFFFVLFFVFYFIIILCLVCFFCLLDDCPARKGTKPVLAQSTFIPMEHAEHFCGFDMFCSWWGSSHELSL